jgi:hypothetical protein
MLAKGFHKKWEQVEERYALWLAESGVVEVYADSGKLLKTISSETGEKKAA